MARLRENVRSRKPAGDLVAARMVRTKRTFLSFLPFNHSPLRTHCRDVGVSLLQSTYTVTSRGFCTTYHVSPQLASWIVSGAGGWPRDCCADGPCCSESSSVR